MQLQAKRAVITGGGSGLGRELCLQLAALGVRLAVTDINPETGKETLKRVNELQGADARHNFVAVCDVGSEAGIARLAEEVRNRWAGLDILINNAGIAAAGRVDETSEADWQRMLDINLLSAARSARAFVPLLRAQGAGHIVNVASFAGLACAPGMASYNVAKAGLIALSETMRAELAPAGVGVSVACPAFFTSNLLNSITGQAEIKGQIERIMRRSRVQVGDVARDIIEAIENNRFMIISHPEARRAYLLKRLMPERFFRMILKKSGHLMSSKKS